MNEKIIAATSSPIVGEDGVKAFLSFVMNDLELRMGFHPDNTFDEYINYETDQRLFTDEEAALLDKSLNECFEQCEKIDIDIYGICLDILKPTIDQFNKS